MFPIQLLHTSLHKILYSLKLQMTLTAFRIPYVDKKKKKSKKKKRNSNNPPKSEMTLIKHTENEIEEKESTAREHEENTIEYTDNVIEGCVPQNRIPIDFDAENGWTTVVSKRKSRSSSWC